MGAQSMVFPVSGAVFRPVNLLFAWICLCGITVPAGENTSAGLNDLVILDPGKHERGLPAVELQYHADGPHVDIPPTVHVHRYYYSGDKTFQGPIIQGGPTVVVASHPKSGVQMNIDVVLPPGAPRIAYSGHSITYIYPDQRVEIKFQHFPFDPCVAVVKHHHGKGLRQRVDETRQDTREHLKESLVNSQVVHAATEVGSEGGQVVKGVAASIGELSAKGADALKTLSNMIPGVVYLKSKGEQRAQQAYESSVEHAQLKKEYHEPDFVRTNQ